jgi:hypothetical protein
MIVCQCLFGYYSSSIIIPLSLLPHDLLHRVGVKLVAPVGLEPTTFSLKGSYSKPIELQGHKLYWISRTFAFHIYLSRIFQCVFQSANNLLRGNRTHITSVSCWCFCHISYYNVIANKSFAALQHCKSIDILRFIYIDFKRY